MVNSKNKFEKRIQIVDGIRRIRVTQDTEQTFMPKDVAIFTQLLKAILHSEH